MVGSGLSILIELIVSLLLVVTISYCFIVNRKLTAIRADQSGLRQVIGELNRSSERAELAIAEMRRAAQNIDQEMSGHVTAAHMARDELIELVERTKGVQMQIEKLTDVDLKALQLVSKAANASSVSNEQLQLAKQLKRQRLGFGRERVFPSQTVENQALTDDKQKRVAKGSG